MICNYIISTLISFYLDIFQRRSYKISCHKYHIKNMQLKSFKCKFYDHELKVVQNSSLIYRLGQ